MMWAADHDTWGTIRQCRTWKSPEAAEETGYVEVSKGDIGMLGNAALARKTDPAPHLCPIRFQGQWEDEETGLYYNRARHYEPLIGSYLSKDFIGLPAGARNSGYSRSPLKYIDVLGFSCCRVTPEMLDGCCDVLQMANLARSAGMEAGAVSRMIMPTGQVIAGSSGHTITNKDALALVMNAGRRTGGADWSPDYAVRCDQPHLSGPI